MKKTYPEDIDQIGTFYKGKLKDKEISPSDGLWNNIISGLDPVAPASNATDPNQVNLINNQPLVKPGFSPLGFKGSALIISVLSITILSYVGFQYFNRNRGSEKIPVNQKTDNAVNDSLIVNQPIEKDITPANASGAKGQKAQDPEKITESKLLPVKDSIPSSPVQQEVLPSDEVIPDQKMDTLKTPKSKTTQSIEENEPLNFFEKKRKLQKDTSSDIFKSQKK